MDTIFKILNYRITDSNEYGKSLSAIIVNNTDGSPRWICPADSRQPLFLKFYSTASGRSRMIAKLIQLVFLLRLQKLFFKTTTFKLTKDNHTAECPIDLFSQNWAIFTGTIGPNNKIVIYQEDIHGNHFKKVATSVTSIDILENEKNAIDRLHALAPGTFHFPHITNQKENYLQLTDISKNGKRLNQFSQYHADALNEINENTNITMKLNELPVFIDTIDKLTKLNENKDKRMPKGIVRKLNNLLNSIKDFDEEIEVCMSHGDFTPWNMYINGERLHIYDWELANPLMPIGFDAFHFIIQNGILNKRKNWTEIQMEIYQCLSPELFRKWSSHQNAATDKYLRLYLLINLTQSLDLYSQQPIWHTQIHWLINTWNEGISHIMMYEKNNRELIITDIFDFLLPKEYATIKFPQGLPEKLSEYSDIDIFITASNQKELLKFISQHPLVKHISKNSRTHMQTLHVILKDDRILSIDCIWKFKRKALTLMDVNEVLNSTFQTEFGVKMMDPLNQARYIGLFYGLNNAKIPARFQAYEQILSTPKNSVDNIIYCNMVDYTIRKDKLEAQLKKQSMNNPLNLFIGKIEYLLDTARQILFNKGLLITFSGVDGSGKSTIIERTKFELEKKLRKRVVVLRHRPSLLPILSAWTKGKAAAEKEAATRLPRQGTNQSKLSSYLRFSYYYMDYLMGQFYVHFRYIRRGYVVLYDRYYFDFIIDGKRTNINLAPDLTRMLYSLIMKPDLNFFLHAHSSIILSRKQEMTAETIEELNKRYTELFTELESKSATGAERYIIIENKEMDVTLEKIINLTHQKAA